MSTDETPPEGGPDIQGPRQNTWRDRWEGFRRTVSERWPAALKGPVAIAVAGALILGFGGGFAVGKGGLFFGGGKPAGKSMLTECSWIGMVMISMMISTSITSISGVVLMSTITSGSSPPALPTFIAMTWSL